MEREGYRERWGIEKVKEIKWQEQISRHVKGLEGLRDKKKEWGVESRETSEEKDEEKKQA